MKHQYDLSALDLYIHPIQTKHTLLKTIGL